MTYKDLIVSTPALRYAVYAALMLGALPAAAVMPHAAAQTPTMPAADAVARFYESRQNELLWFHGTARSETATRLVSILQRAPIDGLSTGPQLASQVEAAIRSAQSGDRAQALAADRLLSSAWVLYVQAISKPTDGMIYGNQAPQVPNPGRILYAAAHAASLTQHLQTVSSVNPIYAGLRDAALRQAQASGGVAPDPRLLANMERVRTIPGSGRFVLVDAATQRLWMYENGQPVDSMKVIVGTSETPTPMIASMIHFATLNPYWNVPDNLIRKTVAPNAVKQGLGYLKTHGYQVMSDWTANATVIPSSEIDWKAVAAGQKTVRVRQLPGPDNFMGELKFSFPNGEEIFLHDTPSKDLFAKSTRTFSNGCIRLEDAKRLGRWLLGQEPVTSSTDPEQFVQLPQGVPVYVTYLTAYPNGSELTFADDVYGRDLMATSRIASVGGQSSGTERAETPQATP